MNIDQTQTHNGWKHFILTNDHGLTMGILDYGGIVTHMLVPDRNGYVENIVLGYRKLENYEANPNFIGAIIGRTAGRIRDAAFKFNKRTYHLDQNEGHHHLHGGDQGFNQVVWETETFHTETSIGVKLSHTSPTGSGGYPGCVHAVVTYTLTNDNRLSIAYEATTDQTTPIALTNHSYFNLAGNLSQHVQDHIVTLPSNYVAELDQDLLPTGDFLPVAGTSFDFKMGRNLGDGFDVSPSSTENLNWVDEQLALVGSGYDHYFLLDQDSVTQLTITEPVSGRKMIIDTDQPGVVMYTANGLDEGLELNEGLSSKHLGVCFETQTHPAALHHSGFPSIMVEPKRPYRTQTTFTFRTI